MVHLLLQAQLGCEVASYALLDRRKDTGLIVYPEGHRYKGEGTLKLKTGVMEVAYNLNVPCQCVITNGKVVSDVAVKSRRICLTRSTSV